MDIKCCQILFCISTDHPMIFTFIILMLYITFIDLSVLNHPCIPGINPTWSWWIILLKCHRIWFVSILLSFLHYILQEYCSTVFLQCFYLALMSGSCKMSLEVFLVSFWNPYEPIWTKRQQQARKCGADTAAQGEMAESAFRFLPLT